MENGTLNEDKLHNQLIKYANSVSTLHKKLKEENTLLKRANKDLEESFYDTILMGFDVITLYDEFLGRHCKRVAYYSSRLATSLKMRKKSVVNIKLAALLHDIGLIGVPKRELKNMFSGSKKALLDIYIKHPIVNIRPLKSSGRYKEISHIISAHHENLDGSGFPNGLKGKEIPVESRIIAVTNGYDVQKELHSKTVEPEVIISQMQEDVGTKYDRRIFEEFSVMVLKGDPFADSINITIDELSPGMVLAKPVIATDKLKLLSADTELREDHIEYLRRFFGYGRITEPIRIYKPEA